MAYPDPLTFTAVVTRVSGTKDVPAPGQFMMTYHLEKENPGSTPASFDVTSVQANADDYPTGQRLTVSFTKLP